jgi:predicted nucleotidyltransferase
MLKDLIEHNDYISFSLLLPYAWSAKKVLATLIQEDKIDFLEKVLPQIVSNTELMKTIFEQSIQFNNLDFFETILPFIAPALIKDSYNVLIQENKFEFIENILPSTVYKLLSKWVLPNKEPFIEKMRPFLPAQEEIANDDNHHLIEYMSNDYTANPEALDFS